MTKLKWALKIKTEDGYKEIPSPENGSFRLDAHTFDPLTCLEDDVPFICWNFETRIFQAYRMGFILTTITRGLRFLLPKRKA